MKVRKMATIRNQYTQVPHLTQDTNGKVTNSQLDITNESHEVSPFPAGDHKASINRRARKHTKMYRLGTVSKNIRFVKFHLNISNGYQVIERIIFCDGQTDGRTQEEKTKYLPTLPAGRHKFTRWLRT